MYEEEKRGKYKRIVERGDIGVRKEMKKVEDDSGEKKRMWGVGGG
jgi:hypothetical protein